MKVPPKKPSNMAGEKSLVKSSDTSPPEPLFYAADEKFLWLDAAVELDQADKKSFYADVRSSAENARQSLVHLMRSEFAQDDLPKYRTPSGDDEVSLRKRRALQTVKATGSLKHRIVAFQIREALQNDDGEFFQKIGKAIALKKRPPIFDYERVSEVPRFLVENWCGTSRSGSYEMWLRLVKADNSGDDDTLTFDKSEPFYFLPPLCFLNEVMLARFCADALQINRNDPQMHPRAIAKWISRLGLKTAKKPRITGLDRDADGRVKLRVVT